MRFDLLFAAALPAGHPRGYTPVAANGEDITGEDGVKVIDNTMTGGNTDEENYDRYQKRAGYDSGPTRDII